MNSTTLLARHLMRRNLLSRRRAAGLLARERLSPDGLRDRQQALLRATLDAARRKLPYYASAPEAPAGVDMHAWLGEHFRVVSKPDLLARRTELYPAGGRRRPWWPLGKTSGTTGAPLEVFRSIASVAWEEAFNMQAWSWAGFRGGQVQAVLRGDDVAAVAQSRPPFWYWDRFGRQLFMSTRHLLAANAAPMLDALKAARPAMLRAYPSSCAELARLADSIGYELRLAAVVTGSEPLYPVQRELVERVFGCKVFDFYGMAERVAYAVQCEHGHYHINPEYSVVEILDDRSKPTDDFGCIVGTTLHNHAMPLVRYRIADRARWIPGPCACGRGYPRIELSSGKVEDQLFDREGAPVSASIITFAFKGLSNIRKSQVAQIGPGQWEVRLVPEAGYSEADGGALLANFSKYISNKLDVRLRIVDDIPLLPSGKYKWVAQEWQEACWKSDAWPTQGRFIGAPL
ncbi:phenylacetate--CoA ligase family protein [Massilia sp. RP-1-19]|uniref:Phenylacetate--CoA ligase family protein n=1 Tax=Massilia polaris TaxID=2728846 RepID=A0A848HLL5_9BURK|nr:AMP-binding protein [Massilia polaris]NML62114.1 phenylacetate--CoA ligase family protein [Massilia polaris]